MGGVTGLDYAGVRAYLDEVQITGPGRRDIWNAITAAERGTLEGWRSKAQQNKSNKK